MKRILITGANSYIGSSFDKWINKTPDEYLVDTLNMIDGSWKNESFSGYDAIYHVAGIAHIKETKENTDLYYQVNRDLAYETALKAKNEGIKQFIFLSTMNVYGIETGVITKETHTNPKTHYGNSKLQAEELISKLSDESFKVAIIRPPMVYGKGCKGNYARLANLARKVPAFPKVQNMRSMIYIDNLNQFIKLIIDEEDAGLFFPQNKEYVNTSEMVKLIAQAHEKKIWMTDMFNFLLRLIKSSTLDKLFGNLIYQSELSEYKREFCVVDFKSSILATEKE